MVFVFIACEGIEGVCTLGYYELDRTILFRSLRPPPQRCVYLDLVEQEKGLFSLGDG